MKQQTHFMSSKQKISYKRLSSRIEPQNLERIDSHLHEEQAAAITGTLLMLSSIKACPGNKSQAVISNDDLPTDGNSISVPVNEFSALEAFAMRIAQFLCRLVGDRPSGG